ncbi:MAG: DUF3179 domain-containing (seleno)protein [Flavobacteriaceae bacterium]
MKNLFYIGIIGIILFEILKVYFIMPMPGSQEIHSIDVAYFLHSWRWMFRVVLGGLALAGILWAYRSQRWVTLLFVAICLLVAWQFNFKLAADNMFLPPAELVMVDHIENKIPSEKLVLGIHHNGEARAYPIQLIAYHHQVLDSLEGNPIMVTYCSVCRSGRVFEPNVNGSPESFRLVGMDQFNAMFEDKTTQTWWRQASGEAIAGPLKGSILPELPSQQTTLKQWLTLYPNSKVMQPDSAFIKEYSDLDDYDFGIERGDLTRTDTLSWQNKSWVVGLELASSSKAIDWNLLKEKRILNLTLADTPIVLALASDNQSFFAFERPSDKSFTLVNDSLVVENIKYNLLGYSTAANVTPLKPVKAYQEFWHSWRTFHPDAEKK